MSQIKPVPCLLPLLVLVIIFGVTLAECGKRVPVQPQQQYRVTVIAGHKRSDHLSLVCHAATPQDNRLKSGKAFFKMESKHNSRVVNKVTVAKIGKVKTRDALPSTKPVYQREKIAEVDNQASVNIDKLIEIRKQANRENNN